MKKNPNSALVAAKATINTLHRELDKARKGRYDLEMLATKKFKIDGEHIGKLHASLCEHRKIIAAGSANRSALRSKVAELEHAIVQLKLDIKGWKFATGVLAVLVIGYAATFYYAGLL